MSAANSFLKRLNNPQPIILDGATGSELNARGINTGLPLWSSWALIDSPQTLAKIHYDYLKAGAEVITTNTFRTHRRSLEKAGMGSRAQELTSKAVQTANDVRNIFMKEGGHPAWIAGSISPLEDCYSPNLVPIQNECEIEHEELAINLANDGVDIILIETMNTIREAISAIKGAKLTKLPFLVSFVLSSNGNLMSGETLEEMVNEVSKHEPTMIGINCTPTQTIGRALKKLTTLTELPVFGYGNIGQTDHIEGWTNTEEVTISEYKKVSNDWIKSGVRMIGGCCGTNPEYIKSIANLGHK